MAPSQSVSQSNSELLRVEDTVGQRKERKSKGEAKRGEDGMGEKSYEIKWEVMHLQ